MNLRSVDLNLLVVFEAVIRERSVSGAARQLGMTPSAVSHALGRLRLLLNDELMKRTPRGFEPTRRAIELAAQVGDGLKTIESAIEDLSRFDARHSARAFTLLVSDYVGGFLLPPLCERLRTEAPQIKLLVEHLPTHPSQADSSDLHVRVGWMPHPHEYRRERLFEDSFVVVMRPDHPHAARPMTLDTYVSLSHLKLSAATIGTMMIDDSLAKRGLTRNIVVTVSNWFEVASIVERTDLVAVMPRQWASIDRRLASLAQHPLPLDDVRFTVDQCWHPRNETDPGHRWLRGLVATMFREAGEQCFSIAPDVTPAPRIRSRIGRPSGFAGGSHATFSD